MTTIKDYPNYNICENGIIFDKKNKKKIHPFHKPEGLIVSLKNDYGIKRFRVSKLLAITFIPNPDNKQRVTHIDGNPFNINLSNIRWGNKEKPKKEPRKKKVPKFNTLDEYKKFYNL
tara:strand:+ start:1404 stop:1754 length:351 start_codon:yes stop_codon:yes gene_type:complete